MRTIRGKRFYSDAELFTMSSELRTEISRLETDLECVESQLKIQKGLTELLQRSNDIFREIISTISEKSKLPDVIHLPDGGSNEEIP